MCAAPVGTRSLHALPLVKDGWTFLYVEHVRIEREDAALVLWDKIGKTSVPVAALASLMLGPGSTISHAAMDAAAASGCSVVWCGEGGVRFYAAGLGETRSADNLLHQAAMCSDPLRRLDVVMRMYRMRFADDFPADLTLEQIRGKEGVRVREAYAELSRETGIQWAGRSYKKNDWHASDAVNRALSAANACLYGICHAAIVSAGFSPGLGFVHTGKSLSFVYDVADLYKLEVTVPVAFRAAKDGAHDLEGRVRRRCRDAFHEAKLLERLIPDIQRALGLRVERATMYAHRPPPAVDEEAAEPAPTLWGPGGSVAGGHNYAQDDDEPGDDS
jgi:CRISPR-associated protein Cas1